jgi:hypothetical protein
MVMKNGQRGMEPSTPIPGGMIEGGLAAVPGGRGHAVMETTYLKGAGYKNNPVTMIPARLSFGF